jgi:hypothetical protein
VAGRKRLDLKKRIDRQHVSSVSVRTVHISFMDSKNACTCTSIATTRQ